MIKLGTILRRLEGRKEAIVKSERTPKIGEMALDEDGEIIGKISDVFGPVDGPYAVIRLVKKQKGAGSALKGKEVFLREK